MTTLKLETRGCDFRPNSEVNKLSDLGNKVFFKHNEDVAARLVIDNAERLTVEDFVKYNIYNTAKIQYNFAKYSPLNAEQKEALKDYLLHFKNGNIGGFNKNLEKWVKDAVKKGIIE